MEIPQRFFLILYKDLNQFFALVQLFTHISYLPLFFAIHKRKSILKFTSYLECMSAYSFLATALSSATTNTYSLNENGNIGLLPNLPKFCLYYLCNKCKKISARLFLTDTSYAKTNIQSLPRILLWFSYQIQQLRYGC